MPLSHSEGLNRQVKSCLPAFWEPVDVSRAAFVAANAVVMGQVSIEAGLIIHAQKYEQLALVHAGKGQNFEFWTKDRND